MLSPKLEWTPTLNNLKFGKFNNKVIRLIPLFSEINFTSISTYVIHCCLAKGGSSGYYDMKKKLNGNKITFFFQVKEYY